MTAEQKRDSAMRRRLAKRLDVLVERIKTTKSPGKRVEDMGRANEIARTLGRAEIYSRDQIRRDQLGVAIRYSD
jgi:hypothetical protein